MGSSLKKVDVENIILSEVQAKNVGRNITLDTPFNDGGLGENGVRRRRYFVPIRNALRAQGFELKSMTANNIAKFGSKAIDTVQDLADAMWSDRAG